MTLEETYNRIISSEDLRNRYEGITDAKSLEGFLEELGCRETSETFIKYVRVKSEGEIPDSEIEAVAGGVGRKKPPLPPLDW